MGKLARFHYTVPQYRARYLREETDLKSYLVVILIASVVATSATTASEEWRIVVRGDLRKEHAIQAAIEDLIAASVGMGVTITDAGASGYVPHDRTIRVGEGHPLSSEDTLQPPDDP